MRDSRKKRLDDLMREVLGEILLTRAADPRLSLVSITRVQISPELDVAKVFVSVMGATGEPARRDEALAALKRAAPFLRSELAKEISIRRTPELRFLLDESVERALHMDSVFQELANERAQREAQDAGASPGGDAQGAKAHGAETQAGAHGGGARAAAPDSGERDDEE